VGDVVIRHFLPGRATVRSILRWRRHFAEGHFEHQFRVQGLLIKRDCLSAVTGKGKVGIQGHRSSLR
jgi:hypothetical protein